MKIPTYTPPAIEQQRPPMPTKKLVVLWIKTAPYAFFAKMEDK